jgi:predicted phage terminase large subunit-like protein
MDEIRPQPGPQEMFLSTPADICIYGGAAGGGKTWGLLLEPLRHINNSDFGAVIFRRTYKQVTMEGGMWDEAQRIYPLLGAQPHISSLSWRFPSGARISFAHMQNTDTYLEYQGAQIALIGFDQLEHFTRQQFFYMLSRNRSTCGVRPYVRATVNPDADSWVADLIKWWVDQDSGLPIEERAGVLRWFVRVRDTIIWGDDPDQLREDYNTEPKSLTFIPAKVQDNPALLAADPGYLANLMALTFVDKERLLSGNWKVRPEAGKVFNRGWFQIVDAAPVGGEECRFWDFAATEKKIKGDDPDFTTGIKIRRVGGVYYVANCLAFQEGPAETDKIFKNVSKQDAYQAKLIGATYKVRWEQEGGASGKRESYRLAKMLDGIDAAGVSPQGDKLVRAKPAAAQCLAGNMKLVRGEWNEQFLSQLHGFPDAPHDDIVDGTSGAYNELALPEEESPAGSSSVTSARGRFE